MSCVGRLYALDVHSIHYLNFSDWLTPTFFSMSLHTTQG